MSSSQPHTVADDLRLAYLLPSMANEVVSNALIVTTSNMLGLPNKLMSPADSLMVSSIKESVLVTGYHMAGTLLRSFVPALRIFTQ